MEVKKTKRNLRYFQFQEFRKALYDAELTPTSKVVYFHLLQKSSQMASVTIDKYTEEQMAEDIGIYTKQGNVGGQAVGKALKQLEEKGYIKKFQKFKKKGCSVTIVMNFDDEFVKQKGSKYIEKCNPKLNVNESKCNPKLNVNDKPLLSTSYHNLSPSYQKLSPSYPSLSDTYKTYNTNREKGEYIELSEERLAEIC